MTLEVYNISNGIPMGKAVIGGGNVEADGMIYQFMGSVATYAALLALDTTDFKPGYVYDVQEDGMDYAWNGTGWNSLGGTHVDFELGAREPLVISADADITVSGQIEYDESTERLNFKQGTPAGEGGSITFTIPVDVNIDALNDYWRIGTKTHNLYCAPNGTDRWSNYKVLEVFDEDDNIVSRVWYGSSDYRKGKSTSTGYYFFSDGGSDRTSKDIMHHNAGESATYQGDNTNDNWSAECTISSKRLKYFVLYYNSMSWSGISMGLAVYDENSYDGQANTYGLSDIRLFRSPTDTEGILLKGDGGQSVKLNLSEDFTVQGGKLCASDSLLGLFDEKQDVLVAGDGVSISTESSGQPLSVLPNNFLADSPLITCDGVESGYEAYKAFDGDSNTYWGGDDTSEHWIMRQHDPIIVKSITMTFREATEIFTEGVVQGSNDGVNFTTLATYSNSLLTAVIDCSSNNTAYTYTKITGIPASGWGKVGEISISYVGTAPVIKSTLTAGNGISIANCIKLPNNLTSDATLSTNSAQSSKPAYYAFDGNAGTFWGAQTGDARWVARQHESIVVKRVDLLFKNAGEAMVSGEIQGSNDGSTYTTIGSFSGNTGIYVTVDCSSNNTAYTYTRIYGNTSGGAWGAVNDIQIYYKASNNANTIESDISSDSVRRIVRLTQAEYDALLNNDTIDPLALYLIVSSS